MFQIYNEDCLEGMQRLSDESIGLVLSDLPYGQMEYAADKALDLERFWGEVWRLLSYGSSVLLFGAGRFTYELIKSNEANYCYKWVWVKNRATNFIHAHNRPLSNYEEILVFSRGKVIHAGKGGERMKYHPQGLKECRQKANENHDLSKKKGSMLGVRPSDSKGYHYVQEYTGYPRDVLNFKMPHTAGRNHPNEKPVELLEYLIRTYSNEGEVVLDCTMGSGSTGVAALKSGRSFIGFETEEKYYKAAEVRLNESASVGKCDIRGEDISEG